MLVSRFHRFFQTGRWGLVALAMVAAVLISCVKAEEKPAKTATLEKPVKDFSLKDVVSGKDVSLSQFKDKVVVLMWHSPGCLTSPRYEKRVKEFVDSYKDKEVVLLGINSSSGDDVESLRDYAKDQEFNFALLRDADASIARYFDVDHTGTFLVIDAERKLRYLGGFDDNPNSTRVKRHYVKGAVDSILAGKKFLLRHTFPFG